MFYIICKLTSVKLKRHDAPINCSEIATFRKIKYHIKPEGPSLILPQIIERKQKVD